MENGDLLKYNLSNNKFEILKNDERGLILQNLLSLLVDSEDSEKESESFDYFKNIFTHCEFNQRDSNAKNKKANTESDIIRLLYDRISKNYEEENEVKCKNLLNIENDFSLLKIDYPSIITLNFRLVSIIKNFIDKKQKEFDSNIKNMLHRNIRELKFLKICQYNFLQDLETIKTIEIKLSNKKHDSIVNLDYILFFCIFFSFLFPYVLDVNLNLNCDKIDRFFYRERNPYKIVDKLAMKIAKKYEKILIANLIVSKLVLRHDSIINLKLDTSDSYVLELNETTANEFIFRNKNENGFHEYNLMKFTYLDSLLNLNNLYRLECNFNSLDSVLFQKVNLILIKNISIVSLNLNLFPKDMKFNIRKFYLNDKFYFDEKKDNRFNFVNKDEDLYWDLISNSNQNSLTYTHRKILKILFERFNENLKNLIVILNSKIRKLKYLKISLNPFRFLNNYDFYNSSIACFIFDILKILSNYSNRNLIDLIEFELNSSSLNFDFSNFKNFEIDFNLNKVKIDELNLNLNIWNVMNFDQLPNEYLNSLTLNKISVEDFTKFQEFLYVKLVKENEKILNNLIYLKISVSLKLFYHADDESRFCNSLCEIFKNKLPYNLHEIYLLIENKIDIKTLMIMLYNIKKYSHSIIKKVKLQVNLCLKNYKKISDDFRENFLEETKVISKSSNAIIQLDLFKIKQNSINHLCRILFAIKKSKIFLRKLKDDVIIMQLTKFLFTNKSKRIEVFIENKLDNSFNDY